MEEMDVVIIGAGVVGLAIADALADAARSVAVVEMHESFGRETSSRNSEVIHCGMYYAETLLKTTLCVRGNPMLYELASREGIPHRRTGKLVVATSAQEEAAVDKLFRQGTKNGVPGLRLVSAREIHEMEPAVRAVMGLFSPSTGIIDSHQLMAFLERRASSRGAMIAYGCTVTGVRPSADGHVVEVREPDGGTTLLKAAVLVNSAGLHADGIAAMAGIDVDAAGYRLRPCKGEYFRVAARHRGTLKHLVYPVPSHVHLGAHALFDLDGSLKVGPNSIYVDDLNYDVDPAHQAEFHEKAHEFLPFIERDDLAPDMSGIRPKLYRENEPFRDFVIREESDKGLPGLVNLIGMESPGLTSCLTIARMVKDMC